MHVDVVLRNSRRCDTKTDQRGEQYRDDGGVGVEWWAHVQSYWTMNSRTMRARDPG